MNTIGNKRSFVLPSIGDFLFLAIFLLISLYAGKNLLNDGDTGYHIRAGEYILTTLSVPRYDMFSYLSPPLPWTAHEWLSEVIMALIHGAFGMTGIVVFFAFLIALTSFLLFKTSHTVDNDILVSLFIVILATAASRLHWLARPHVFSLVLMVVWYYLLDLYQYKGKNRLHLLPFIMLLWANLHGGFMGGFILLAAYFLGNCIDACFKEERERAESLGKAKAILLTTVICVAVTVINPYGFHILLFPFKLTSSKELMDAVSEFISPNFHESNALYFEVLLLVFVAAIGASRYKLNAIEIILSILFIHMSLYSARYIPLFAIIATPVLSRKLNALLHDSDSRVARFIKKRSFNISGIDSAMAGYFWPLVSVAAVVALSATGKIDFKFNPEIKPVAAIEFLKREKITGNMFNNDEFGDCLIYGVYPGYKVFIDGRLDMYGAERLKEYYKVSSFKQGWEKVIQKYNISWVMFGANTPLSRHLLIHKDWKLIYADKVTNIFVKTVPEHRHLIEKYHAVQPVVPATSVSERTLWQKISG